jgi:hypothetical protein
VNTPEPGQVRGAPATSLGVFWKQMRRDPDEQALFALLGVDENASWQEVRRAFRTAVLASHPDLHVNDPDAEQRLKTLNASWESVNTPDKWAEYILPPASRGPTDSAARARSRTAPLSVGRLRVQRQQRGCVGMLSWTLEVDGEATASIKNGGVSTLEVAPGRHLLRVFYGSHSSLPLQVELRRRQELVLGCRQIENLRTHLFSPKRSLVLELIGSRRLV